MALACAPRPQAARRIRHGIAAQRSRIRTLPSLRYGMISRIDLKAVALMRFFLNALSRAILASILIASIAGVAHAQTGFDRPGGDYARFVVPSGDPAVCATRCDREGRCRAWSFSYPGTGGGTSAICWLKSEVKPVVENQCCVSGIKGAGLVEKKSGPVEMSI